MLETASMGAGLPRIKPPQLLAVIRSSFFQRGDQGECLGVILRASCRRFVRSIRAAVRTLPCLTRNSLRTQLFRAMDSGSTSPGYPTRSEASSGSASTRMATRVERKNWYWRSGRTALNSATGLSPETRSSFGRVMLIPGFPVCGRTT